MIELRELTKRFDDFTAVDRVNLSVPEGEILALLGPNGAGKTTTVRMLAAILDPTEGEACVAGYSVVDFPQEVRKRVGLLTEHPGLYLRMRGREYLDFFGRIMGLDADLRERRARDLLSYFGMADAWDRRMGTYSKGMRQKMALVRAMLHDPSVLLLDEPTSAMDPYSAKLVRDAVSKLRREHRSIIICTHNLAEAEQLADRIAIIRRGGIIARGTPLELKRRLLGTPLMEIRLSHSLDGLSKSLAKFVEIENSGRNWIRYYAAEPESDNPQVIRTLTQQGADIVTVSEVERSLEDVYLQVVQE